MGIRGSDFYVTGNHARTADGDVAVLLAKDFARLNGGFLTDANSLLVTFYTDISGNITVSANHDDIIRTLDRQIPIKNRSLLQHDPITLTKDSNDSAYRPFHMADVIRRPIQKNRGDSDRSYFGYRKREFFLFTQDSNDVTELFIEIK